MFQLIQTYLGIEADNEPRRANGTWLVERAAEHVPTPGFLGLPYVDAVNKVAPKGSQHAQA